MEGYIVVKSKRNQTHTQRISKHDKTRKRLSWALKLLRGGEREGGREGGREGTKRFQVFILLVLHFF